MNTQIKNVHSAIVTIAVGVCVAFSSVPFVVSALTIYVPTITVSVNGIVRTSTAELSRFGLKRNAVGESEHEHDNATVVEPVEQEEENSTTVGNEDTVVTIANGDTPDNNNGGTTAGSGGDGGRGDRGGSTRSGGAVTNSNSLNALDTIVHNIFDIFVTR